MSPLTPREPRRVVVIGAGAAGSMAAIFAAKGGAETTLLERTRDGGRKILISGGGRCNVLPMHVDESRFVTDSSPNLLHRMLRAWPLREQIAFFENELQSAARRRSRVVEAVSEVEQGARRARRIARVRDPRRRDAAHEHRRHRLHVRSTADGAWNCDGAPPIDADAVIVATGGLSVPNTGSDGLGSARARAPRPHRATRRTRR